MTEHHRAFADHMYGALNRRDLAAFLDGVAEDVEFRSLIAESEGETFHGHDGVRQWWTQVVQALGGVGFEIQDYSEDGDAIVAKLTVRATVGATGVAQVMWQSVVRGEDGRCVWWQTFRSEDEAWEAVRERLGR